MGELDTLTGSALAQIRDAGTLPELEEIRVRWLGKKGTLTEQLKSLGALPAGQRPGAGASINAAKSALQDAIEQRRAELERAHIGQALAAGAIDISLPGRGEAIL